MQLTYTGLLTTSLLLTSKQVLVLCVFWLLFFNIASLQKVIYNTVYFQSWGVESDRVVGGRYITAILGAKYHLKLPEAPKNQILSGALFFFNKYYISYNDLNVIANFQQYCLFPSFLSNEKDSVKPHVPCLGHTHVLILLEISFKYCLGQ